MFKAMGPGGIVSLPMRVELVECIGGMTEEGGEEVFRILVIRG